VIHIPASKLRRQQKCQLGGLQCVCLWHYTDGSTRLALEVDAPAILARDGEPLSEQLYRGDQLVLPAGRYVSVHPSIAPSYGSNTLVRVSVSPEEVASP